MPGESESKLLCPNCARTQNCWIETGRLLPRVFPRHEAIGLARLQNDLLLALTARHTGMIFVTSDPHFSALRRHVPFALKVLVAS